MTTKLIVMLSLQDRCRATVLSHLTHEEQIDQLKLPLRIKHFISEGLENFQVCDRLWLAQDNFL